MLTEWRNLIKEFEAESGKNPSPSKERNRQKGMDDLSSEKGERGKAAGGRKEKGLGSLKKGRGGGGGTTWKS